MKPLFFLVFILFFPLFAATPPPQNTPARTGKDYAVFFYVTDYTDRQLTPLPETKIECEKIAKELYDNFGFVKPEMVANPTRQQIRDKIREYNARTYNPNDQVLFFFSMHGHYDGGQTDDGRGYLIAKDGKWGDLYGDSYYSYDDLRTDLGQNKCQHLLLAFDACYSGAFGIRKKGPSGPDYDEQPDCATKINKALQYKSRLYWCSGSKKDRTPAKSQFASQWLETLRTGGDGGIVRSQDLNFALSKVEEPRCEAGTFSGHDEGGNFVFVRNNTCGSPPPPPISNDRDGDGILNSADQCPDQYGIAAKSGCPDDGNSDEGNFTNSGNIDRGKIPNNGNSDRGNSTDTDLDGIPNTTDACPEAYGTAKAKGCPDADDDGVPDKSDKCPNEKGETTREGCPKPDNMILVKGGTFQMGSNDKDAGTDEKTVHAVTLSDYYIGKTEVTQAQWRSVMGSNPPELNFKGCDECPVEGVSWNDIQAFLTKINQQTGKTYRLPTEAEWEYAARGGNKSKGYTYAGSNTVEDVAWLSSNSGSKTHPVATKQANELGLYDMSGNVWEWCNDWHDSDYYKNSPKVSPAGPSTGSYRVDRGGSWRDNSEGCRVSRRGDNTPGRRSYSIGFRLASSPQ